MQLPHSSQEDLLIEIAKREAQNPTKEDDSNIIGRDIFNFMTRIVCFSTTYAISYTLYTLF
jgi:hypothetical protein